jgi:exosome complex component MTR3
LGAHLETALRGVIIGERWPKSGVDVIITILEGEEDRWWGDEFTGAISVFSVGSWGLMSVLAGCITAASAALADAGIDCVDLAAGGVAALVRNPDTKGKSKQIQTANSTGALILDPSPCEHQEIAAICVVGYLPNRDEITELWLNGDAGGFAEQLIDRAVEAAAATSAVLVEAVQDAAKIRYPELAAQTDTKMTG